MTILQRFTAYEPGGDKRAVLPQISDWAYSSPFDDASSIKASYTDGLPGWDALLTPCEVAVELSIDGGLTWTEKPNARWLRLERGIEALAPVKSRTYTMPSYAFLLQKAEMLRTTGLTQDGKYMFNAASAGGVLKGLLDDAKLLGWAPSLTYSFTGAVDSAGAPWATTFTIGYEPGLTLWAILNDLTDKGIVDWCFVGRELRVYNADTVLMNTLPLLLERNALSKMTVSGDLTDLVHEVRVFGNDAKTVIKTNNITPQYWGKWFGTVSQGGTDDSDTLGLYGTAYLDENAQEKIQYAVDLDMTKTPCNPLFDFSPGDFVNIRDENNASQSFRVRSINFSRNTSGQLTCTLIINDRFIETSIRSARRTNGIVNGTTASNTTSGAIGKPNKGKPAQGTNLVAVATSYLDGFGYARDVVSLTYDAITTDVNGNALVTKRYEFRARDTSLGYTLWQDWGWTDQLRNDKGGLAYGITYAVQYRAVSDFGVTGDWSAETNVTTPADTVAPPKPSTPVPTSRLGTMTVSWDGKNSIGGSMGTDFSQCEIWALNGGTSSVIGILNNGRAPAVFTAVTIGQTYEVWLRPYDRTGNVGPDSTHASVTVVGVMSDPQAALDINTNITVGKNTYSPNDPSGTGVDGALWYKLSSGKIIGQWHYSTSAGAWVSDLLAGSIIASLDAGQITTGTLAAARIASATITADMIAAGAIDATKLTATAIDGKTISAPVINGGTITGTAFQTALPGAANRTVIGFDGRFYGFGYNQATSATEMMWDFKPYAAADATSTKWGYCKFYMPVWANVGVVAYRVSNKDTDGDPMFGQELGLLGYTTDYGGSSLYLTADNNSGAQGRIYSISIYARTYTSAANMYITSSYTIGRSTSATRYKDNISELGHELVMVDDSGQVVKDSAGDTIVSYRDILSLEPKVWYDHGTAEHYAASLVDGEEDNADIPRLEPIPGLIAEDVLAALGPEFVEFGADGTTVEGIMYDRVWILLIPIIRDLKKRIGALEASK